LARQFAPQPACGFGRSLSQDVRIELALEIRELVFKQQFALFQPLHAELVGQKVFRQARNGVVEIVMLRPKLIDALSQGRL
jgi:hypothetical protein